MPEHPNATRIRETYAALAADDLATVLAAFDPDVVLHVGGSGEMAGDHKGLDSLAEVVGHIIELTGGTWRLTVQNVFADAEYAAVHVHETATRAADGAVLDVYEVNLLRLGPDGRVVDFRDIPADPITHDAFFDGR